LPLAASIVLLGDHVASVTILTHPDDEETVPRALKILESTRVESAR